MASYLRGWLSYGSSPQEVPTPTLLIPEITTTSDQEAGDELDDDQPPAFPALSSIQRSAGLDVASASLPNRSRGARADSELMPPPALPGMNREEGTSSDILALPPTTTKPMPNVNKKGKVRAKVALTPGHSALDWARMKSSGEDLRAGVTSLLRITPSELKEHRIRDDAWSAFNGKVYNITPYLSFHPGGEKELMRVAGRDGTKLFGLTHSWVNLDYMLDGCMVGFLVPEQS